MEAKLPWDDRIRRRLRLRDLDILMAVIDAGSMSKAAARFNMTQPAVTKVIADLEHTLGARLVNRSRRGVEPTPHGLALVKRGTRYSTSCGTASRTSTFSPIRQRAKSASAARRWWRPPSSGRSLDRLSQQYPRMVFHVVAADAPVLLHRDLSERKVELADLADRRSDRGGGMAEILFHDFLVVATGVKYPLTRRRRLRWPIWRRELGFAVSTVCSRSLVIDSFRACGL